MTPGLITLDMNALEWTNASTADMDTFETIGDGYVSLIESAGDQGLLVAFGGYTYPVGKKLSVLAARQNDTTHQNSVEFARVYDIANKKWYTQLTTGDISRWRMAGCSVVAASDDLSSHSIYVFGAWHKIQGIPTATSTSSPCPLSSGFVHRDNTIRYQHKCQLVQKHTMLVIGGIIPIDGMEYYPQWRNYDTATFANGIGIFDLQTLSWRTNYNASDVEGHAIPSKISDVIGGGSPTGAATLTEPKNGFNSTQLASLFKKRGVRPPTSTAVSPSTSATSTSTSTQLPAAAAASSSLSSGAIAGVTVGSVAGAAAIGALAFYLLVLQRRRKTRLAKQSMPSWVDLPAGKSHKRPQIYPTELPGGHYPPAFELMGDGVVRRAEMPAEGNR
ncbi:uncharacterized protein P174DRAFT_417992 [Aspergillus novofumigatus IBT 16806]|uniref:Kelch repeat protein n=1 Tax=Aspergillus novofumigatus (strain IBT 16806) TaxID=1392255 RepID=A0A2I1CHA0_ASPN1|nr:uncharacterized protein P174DRAFT_417992 [Aspergillus novofumigatus IBT 16806]PKX97012.1 hypothetical protein P174DRAFT_417992 [Aspergillus novofumigatus IBT 16806]